MISFLAPAFLKRLDKKLLQNHPILWISKLHFVLYYTAILWAFTSLIAFVIPIDLKEMVGNGIYYTFFTIIAIVLLCVWIYRNAIFNIESDYGNRKITDEYKVYLVNFLCVFLLFSYAYPFSVIYHSRIANAMSDEELVRDINDLNLAEPFFVRSYYDYKEIQTPVDDTNNTYGYQQYSYKYNIAEYKSWTKYTPYVLIQDTARVPGILNVYELDDQFEILRRDDSKALQAIHRYMSILQKHGEVINFEPSYILSKYRAMCKEPLDVNTTDFNPNPYYTDFYSIETIYRNVAEAKYEKVFVLTWEFNLGVFYFIFYIVLMFMMFKMVRWQQFLITIVSMILIPILLFIFGMLLSWGHGEAFEVFFMTSILLIYFTALGFSISFFVNPKRFSGFKSICMQYVYFFTPLFFVFFIFYLDEHTEIFMRHSYPYTYTEPVYDNMKMAATVYNDEYYISQGEYTYYRDLFKTLMWAAVYFGFLFHISFFMVFMKQQFLKMKAMPKNS